MKSSIKICPTTRGAVLGAVITAAVLAVSGVNVLGQAFTPGNLIVVQDGNAAQSMSSSGSQVVLDQITTSGTLVSSLALPTNTPSAFLQNGTSITEGFVNLTPNGQDLVLAGYNVSYGYTNTAISSAPAASIPRAVATVDVNGNFSLVTNSTILFSGANIRSAAGDSNFHFWAEGSSGGMGYLGTGSQTALTGSVLNSRVIQVIGGNLYYSTGSDKRGIIMVSGEPTVSPATTNYIIPSGAYFNSTVPSPYAFVFDPGMTVCYVADATTYTNPATIGGVEKWTNNGSGTFVFSYTLQPGPAGNTNGAVGLAASFGATTNLYGTLADGTNLFAITDTGPSSIGSAIYHCTTNEMLRGVRFAPTNGVTPAAAVIAAVNPASQTVNVGSTLTFTVLANVGTPAASNFWYEVSNSVTYLIPGATGTTLTLTNVQVSASGGYYAVLTNNSASVTSRVATLTVIAKPTVSGISPVSTTVNAGQTVVFTLTDTTGVPTANTYWYQVSGTTPHLSTNFISSTLGGVPALVLTNVLGTNSGGYYAILTNTSGAATSAIASLTVIEPIIGVEPANAVGLVNGQAQFGVTVFGTAPVSYQWYFSDVSGDIIAPVSNGTQADNSVVYGSASSLLTVSNLQTTAALTNFVVVIKNIYGAATSSVASLLYVTNSQAVLALWDFDGQQFTNIIANPFCVYDPAPFVGYGTALPVGLAYNPELVINAADIATTTYSPFAGATDPADVGYDPAGGGYVFTPYGFEQPSPNNSWGTDNYPAVSGTNKQNGVQFNVSTVGAKNIIVNYDGRVSATASEYDRLQYTTNGTTWIDYPASTTFNGSFGSGNAGYLSFAYSLVGFPGVENNPNFGIRVVTEWQSTATYQTPATMADTNDLGVNGVLATNWWVGTANVYSSGASGNAAAGTVTYDLVAIRGDAITNNNVPPTLALLNLPITNGVAYTNMVDTNTLTLNFTATGDTTPPDQLTYSAVTLGDVSQSVIPSTLANAEFSLGGAGSNRTLTISFPSPIPDPQDAGPILITATDANGDSSSVWFDLNVSSINQPPTNSLTSLHGTNLLVNSTITVPFIVGSARDPYANLTYAVSSDNNNVLPAASLVIGGSTGTGNPTLTIAPAAGQVGDALITVTVSDNDPVEPRSTTANIAVTVLPNTNIVAIDYFNYTSSGPLDGIAFNYWTHLSGNDGQLQVESAASGGVATISAGNTENLQAPLVAGPYTTAGGAVLYSSFAINMSPTQLPTANGSYFIALNDGSGNTADVEDCLVATTNGVTTPGDYRLGIGNISGSTRTNSAIFPLDLQPGVPYFVVTALSVSSGLATLWVSPSNQLSASVTDLTPPPSTNLYNIANVELREISGGSEGTINVGSLLVGTTFNSVFYPPQANPDFFAVTENSAGDLFSPLLNDGGSALGLSDVSESDGNGTAIASGNNVTFAPANNFVGVATINYTATDDMGNSSNAVITVTVTNIPPQANPDAYTVLPNSVNNVLNPLTNDVVETPGGTLSLVSVSETDGNGTATKSGNQVLFTPTGNSTSTAIISYVVTDGIGGTNSSLITVSVFNPTPIPLNALLVNNTNLVLSWTNGAYNLQYSTNVVGPYVTIPSATSPYTNQTTTNAVGFFRLVH